MKEKIIKEYLRRTRKLLESRQCSRTLIKGINTGYVWLVRYSGPHFCKLEKNYSKSTSVKENTWLFIRLRKTDYSHWKQYRQHKHQQNKNYQAAKMGHG